MNNWMIALALMLITCCLFGYTNDNASVFEHWLRAAYKYEIDGRDYGDMPFSGTSMSIDSKSDTVILSGYGKSVLPPSVRRRLENK